MYCPKCGHEQPDDDRTFCSECGIRVDAVSAAVVKADGSTAFGWSRRDGIKWAVFIFVAITIGLTPIAGVLELDALSGVFAVLGFGTAVTLMTYSILFLPKHPQRLPKSSSEKAFSGPRGLKGLVKKIGESVRDKISSRKDAEPVAPLPNTFDAPPTGSWKDVDYSESERPQEKRATENDQ